ncbi:MAG: SpoIID/LytB domain-containing protein [Lachnospiraceae bacterium]|nr:SpoIID/LytB domain-containing protein [Lachnospiraceae bacterium]
MRKNEKNSGIKLNRSERIRLKVWICILGFILLLFLMTGRIITQLNRQDKEPESPYIPRYEKLENVWVIEIGEDNILLYRNGLEESYDLGVMEDGSLYQPDWGNREQMADVFLTDGRVTGLTPLTDKLHGVILSADEGFVEVQGYGRIPLASDYRGYRIYSTLSMCTYKDMAFGYDFTELVMKDGEICGILLVREETMEEIRVLIKTSDFQERLHQELVFTCDTDFEIRYGEQGQIVENLRAGEEITVRADSDYLAEGRMYIEPTALTGRILLKNVSRSQGVPGYRGRLELIPETSGFAVINELLLEEYLYSVVPSEMPASYGVEALKAQAVCARTYAYGHMQHAAYPAYGAHVDDSTSYQVYNNVMEQSSTTRAVKETYGMLLFTETEELAETYYYSTSCGVGSDANVWKSDEAGQITYLQARAIREDADQDILEDIGTYLQDEAHFAEFITQTDKAFFESGEGWYRWTYAVPELSVQKLEETLKNRYKTRPELILTKVKTNYIAEEPKTFTEIKSMTISARGKGGVADELLIETDQGTYKVISEHNIRYVLCNGEAKVKLADGRTVDMPYLLPSGFFILETITGKNGKDVVGYTIIGGGYGHGVGMSQNAAKQMAERGYDYGRILLFFYRDCVLRAIYSREQ